ncbi:Putative FAD-linked oxidoreductase OS=Streptomyces lavendulae subsp. lavendulae OX=58340 GN=SLAV_06750 PE=4 SV=1 [Streptomyces lavendulae subsp. lavendulae]
MPPTTDTPLLLSTLRSALPDEALLTDPAALAAHSRDSAPFSACGTPAVVAVPRTAEQVAHVMRTSYALGVPVVPQGARTGLAGAANAVDGCIVLSTAAMDRILSVDPANRLVRCEPGVTTRRLADAVAEHGLTYPPDPASWERCTIGGNIATGAGGICCVKYGVTADYVLGLDLVLPDGRRLRTGRDTVKGVAGYDLTRLVVGSEGTLAVVVGATLALRPARPPASPSSRSSPPSRRPARPSPRSPPRATPRPRWNSSTGPPRRRSWTSAATGCCAPGAPPR